MASALGEFPYSFFAIIYSSRSTVGSSSSSSGGAKYFVQTGVTFAIHSLIFLLLPLCVV